MKVKIPNLTPNDILINVSVANLMSSNRSPIATKYKMFIGLIVHNIYNNNICNYPSWSYVKVSIVYVIPFILFF